MNTLVAELLLYNASAVSRGGVGALVRRRHLPCHGSLFDCTLQICDSQLLYP